MRKLLAGAAVALTVTAIGGVANAATLVYDLNTSAAFPAGSLGTVTATEDGSNLDISVALTGAEFRYSPDGQHVAFVFDLANTGNKIDVASPFFQVATTTATEAPFATPNSTWTYAIDCQDGDKGSPCQQGWTPGVNPTSLSFTIEGASLASLVSNHSYDNQPLWFAADLVTSDGTTGAVGATLTGGGVPEPATWAMMLIGFGGLGAVLRRRREAAAFARI